jgi:hypothetical protein
LCQQKLKRFALVHAFFTHQTDGSQSEQIIIIFETKEVETILEPTKHFRFGNNLH